MRNTAMIDAGPLIALFDNRDKYHAKVVEKIEKYRVSEKGALITTWPIVSEASYILADRVCLEAELDLLEWITIGGLNIFDLRKEHIAGIIKAQRKYADVPMDFADATLVVLAEEKGLNSVMTLDKDFLIYRAGKKNFKNILL